MPAHDLQSTRILVIGAGPSGLTALKNLRSAGFAATAVDRWESLGGNWDITSPHSSVYASTHLISSKRMTQFVDFPLPDHYPEYPHHTQVLDYLHAYADRFELRPHIRCSTLVERIEKQDPHWQVHLTTAAGNKSQEQYDAVVIANGHHAVPLTPNLPGSFTGELYHSHDYKSAEQLRDRRVLVLGAGNSGCDIAVEAAIHARSAAISMRRGYHFFPKFIRGKPADVVGDRLRKWPVPRSWQRAFARMTVGVVVGKPERYGLPRPDHAMFETHPIINSQLPYFAGHGKLAVHSDVVRLDGENVHFSDGSQAPFDTIILATGYKIVFPFIDPALLNFVDGMPNLYLHAFHPTDDTLLVAGMIQPNSGQWGLVDLQMRLAAEFLQAARRGSTQAEWFRQLKRTSGNGLSSGEHFLNTPRHRLEVDYFEYRRTLEKLIRRFRTN